MNAEHIFTPKTLTFSVLRLLADGEFHSGEVLAKHLGVSRASVNNALQGVEQYGLVLFSVRGRGYRLVEPIAWLDAAAVRAELKTPQIFNIDIVDSAASSNSMLLQRATQGMPSGNVLAVEWQSAGRGRLGRTWHSGLGNALTFSVLWRFNFGLSALSGLSLAVGVSMMRAFKKLNVSGVGLKWPNDVLNENGKVAGILIEAQGDMLGPSAVVIGIGMNLRIPSAVAQRIDQPVSDLAHIMKVLPERNYLLALLLQELAEMLSEFSVQGFAPFRDEWESYHLLHNRSVKLHMPDGSLVEGVVRGIAQSGALRVETQHGLKEFNAGEISLREV